jgi:phosphatidylinositol alpha-1,6-mannosyltransferase
LPHISLKKARFKNSNHTSRASNRVKPAVPTNAAEIIFLIRKNPASIGGIQRYCSGLIEGLSTNYNIEQVNWLGPEWGVPFYFPTFYWKTLRSHARLVHCDDSVTSLVGARIRSRTDKMVIANAHGLDVILPIPWYQRRLKQALGKLDRIICLSRATARQVELRGVERSKIEIIPPAAESPDHYFERDEGLYARIENEIGADLRHKRILLSLGRPVARKGFDRFIEDIFPHLPDDYIYIVAGPRPQTPPWIEGLKLFLSKRLYHNLLLASGAYTVHNSLVNLSRHPRVYYLNGVSEELRSLLLGASDLFIMPNRSVEGDMEGFGLVALEAAIRGIPVIATGIEGITDAVIDGKNGFCVAEDDKGGMVSIIMTLLNDPQRLEEFGKCASEFTKKTFSSENTFRRYRKLFDALLSDDVMDDPAKITRTRENRPLFKK